MDLHIRICLLPRLGISNLHLIIFQNLLNKEKLRKTVGDRGTSESTSGCDSGQNYESDEMDNVSAKSASQPPSSEEDSGHVRSSPYVMQGCIAPMASPSTDGML